MKKLHTLLLGLSLIFSSCALFENDVADFMEKYTETAAIEQHTFSIETYTDAANQLCIPSDQDVEITFYMRNPKQFNLVPSVNFENLDGQISRSAVGIEQTEFAIINLTLPQDFLIPADEGKDITPLINLYEPMSGRDFDRYSVSLSCNSKPPAILNPTILNKGNQTFVVAFDMPNEEEVAIRHKDLASVEINGVSYPVQVTTETDSTSDPEHPNLQVARYTFTDAHFKRSYSSSYITLKGKAFEHKANNSVYFETDDAFTNGDKEYSIILRDSAGLTSEVKASTSISKLVKPVIMDQNGGIVSEEGLTGIPFDEDTKKGTVTIIPPTEDHLGNPVSGTTVYYKVYEATGSGLIYTSGTTTDAKTIELPQNTYRVEAYASLTNYENSSTTTVKFRFLNNVLFVTACDSYDGSNRDGSERAPFRTIAEALADIESRERKDAKFTLYVAGDFTGTTYDSTGVASTSNGEITLDDNEVNTGELVITQNPRSSATQAILKTINLDSGLDPALKITIGNVKIINSETSGAGITHSASNTLTIDGTTITGCTQAIHQTTGSLTIKNCTVSNNTVGLRVDDCTRCDIQGGLFDSNTSMAVYFEGNGTYTISGGTFKNNASSYLTSIFIKTASTADCIISGGVIKENHSAGIYVTYDNSSVLKLYGGEISSNRAGGIELENGATLKVKGNPKVQNNTKTTAGNPEKANVILPAGNKIIVDGPLSSGAKIGVTTDTSNEPTQIGHTYDFATGYVNSGSPSQYFSSDRGFSIVAGAGGAVNIAKSGSSGGQYLATDYEFTFAASCGWVEPTQTKTITITPTITRKEPAGSDPATTPIAYSSIASDVSWSVKVMNGGTQVAAFSSNSFTFPAVPAGNYKLLVTATYLGQPHGAEFNIIVTDPEITSGAGHYDSSTTLPNSQVFVHNRVSVENMKNLIACIHEVTQGEYEQYCIYCADDEKNAPSEKYGKGPDYPVYCVNWYEAVMYCNLRSKAENLTPVYYLADATGNEVANGREISTWKALCGTTLINESNGKYFSSIAKRNKSDYTIEEVSQLDYTGSGDTDGGIRFDESANGWRLPTDAEWEFLARGGDLSSEGYTYSGSDNIDEVAWYSGNSAVDGQIQTHPVCTKKPNALGLYDMSGNVYEWCWDYNLYTNHNPLPATTGANGPEVAGMYNSRIIRGGSYSYDAGNNKVVHRPTYDYSQDRFKYLGFRVVRNAD
ncbi:SUMF1/EgtB/PvdO family nonheme iron enzyme [Treponema bryantii]|uniref:SUMF1/EgtB/PvdO family nonheme iron enzyme n=1 Tax=Treponema bryantii TaxID=163 RepID=UPI0003B6E798|nr:SUMF1/EgtB/PvdO family nonheme iron enzyme [Treponema bryantii]